ncbi:GEVED domain-containing protein [Leeuwenhoekiella parthenopeia]|uniref:GEVED domain-containing protein n=1 Tax=Leeuwenhoekiella parthenopeia TaxID=2890320 RepID=A0ABS8GU39_9FLAO|nr:GEVED domain-containing protein [Leeuwenhoekiella parthenopeia]MCC4212078.1 GEVED domain-containing protein [Leeuwenhoekiella parthenopeia]
MFCISLNKVFKIRSYSILVLSLLFSFTSQSYAQEKLAPTTVGKMEFVREVPSLASQIRNGTFIKAEKLSEVEEINPKRRSANQVVPGKGLPKDGDPLVQPKGTKSKGTQKTYELEPIRVFEANTATFTPSDPTGAAGPNHYIAGWNSGFKIYDKQGNLLVQEASLGTLFDGNTAGDPIILYDAAADRFVITEFEEENEEDGFENGFNIAICQGSDPVNDGWYVYTMGFETSTFPDYPKYGIWHDGYYITSNINITGGQTNPSDAVFVMERSKMLTGQTNVGFQGFPLPTLRTNGFFSPQFLSVADGNLPASGPATVVFFQDDSWRNVNDDHLKLWSLSVDWVNPANSSISQPAIIPTADFNSVFDGGDFSNLPQPAGDNIDAMQGTVMQQAQYRKFAGYNSAIFNFVVNVAPAGGKKAGIRWYELRQTADGQPWEIYQEGTYVSPTGHNAFGASMSFDADGSIGMGYSTVSEDLPVTINFTGRYANDPLGVMSVPETVLATSTGFSFVPRYADYTHLTTDPADGRTFWYISEYFRPQRKDVVGVFKLAPDLTNDVQTVALVNPQDGALTATEPITVKIRNAGTATQTSFPVSYRVDGGATVTETFTGSLGFNETADFTFSQTANLSTTGQIYAITVTTRLGNDQDTSNDALTVNVQNLWREDVGVTSIDNPQSGSGLGSAVPVTVTITNFGVEAQSNFPVFYSINSGNQITETFTGTVPAQGTATHTFNRNEDFSDLGTYRITAGTDLPNDKNQTNDMIAVDVVNAYCTPFSDCSSFGDGITQINLEGTTITTACSSDGFEADLDTVFDLDIQNNPYTGTLQAGFDGTVYAIFIDFNKNGGFEASERVSDGLVASAATDTDFTLTLPAGVNLDTYRMRVRGLDSAFSGDAQDPCGTMQYGRTNDYSVRIFNSLSVEENIFPDSELVVIETARDQFQISLSTNQTTEKMAVTVYNLLGQKLANNWIENEYGSYKYDLDMSYASSGVYIVRLGNRDGGQSKKIIVR